jgi:hypothetical protein
MSKWKEIADELKRIDDEEKRNSGKPSSKKKVEFGTENQLLRNRRQTNLEPSSTRRGSYLEPTRTRRGSYLEPPRRRRESSFESTRSRRDSYLEPMRRRDENYFEQTRLRSPTEIRRRNYYNFESDNEFMPQLRNVSKSNLYRVNPVSEFIPYYDPLPEQPLLKLRDITSQHRYPFYQTIVFRTPPNYFHN